MSRIPKLIFQTSKNTRPKDYIVQMIKNMAPGWEYIHFTDSEIYDFFRRNPLPEFENITSVFKSMKSGAHKSDLFRYYFIYIRGGVFFDDDAMIQYDMNVVAGDYDFFTVNSSYWHGCIFQGLIGAVPKNEIIYEALKDAYNLNMNTLNDDYLLICRNLYNIIKSRKWNFKIKLYSETFGSTQTAIIVDEDRNNLIILVHYQQQVVPNEYFKLSHLKQKTKSLSFN
jgi:hypothetical protein